MTDPSATHVFFNTAYPTSRIKRIQIDGVDSNISATHVFQNDGIHVVSVHFKEAEDLNRLFYGATMSECDLTHFDQSKLTSLYATFYNCFELETVILPENFAANVTDFTALFYKNYKLKNIDVTKICTNNATNLYGVFYACDSLQELDLSSWNLSNVVNTSLMFYMCSNLIKVTMSGDVSKISDVNNMFKFTAGGNADENLFGSFYYDANYDYSKIIAALPTDWTAYPIN